MNHCYDVVVLGLGGMGSSAAYHLAGRGSKVLGLESHSMAHDQGSSHGHSRVIRQSYFEHPSYVPLLKRAYELWNRLEQETGEQVLHPCGGLMIGGPDSEVFTGSLSSAREHGLAHEVLSAAEIRRRYPALRPQDHEMAFFEPTAGWLHPEETVRAHLSRAAALGADLHFNEPVTSWRSNSDGEGVVVETRMGTYHADQLVIAPGPWAPELLADLNWPLEVERQVLFWFEPEGSLETFAEPHFPIYIWDCDDGAQFYGFPVQAGVAGVKTAFYRLAQVGLGQNCTPADIDRNVHAQEVETMRRYIRDRIPAMNGRFLDAKTCMYTNTPDGHFAIAKHPRQPQVNIACGFSGHGYKFASVAGEILADLAQKGKTDHPIELFNPGRFLL